MMACYRNASMLMHASIPITDGMDSLAQGDVVAAIRTVFRASVMQSLSALAEQAPRLGRLARRRLRRRAIASAHPGDKPRPRSDVRHRPVLDGPAPPGKRPEVLTAAGGRAGAGVIRTTQGKSRAR
jgi:hypothetical protein